MVLRGMHYRHILFDLAGTRTDKTELIGARRNGLDAAAVGYGFGSAAELRAEAPTHHFQTLAGLQRAFMVCGAPKVGPRRCNPSRGADGFSPIYGFTALSRFSGR